MVGGQVQIGGASFGEHLATSIGIPYVVGAADGISRARYFPGVQQVRVKLLAEPGTGRLIGGQFVGGEGIKERADFLAFALKRGATLEDIAWMENVYSPPIGALYEPLSVAAQNGLAQLCVPRRPGSPELRPRVLRPRQGAPPGARRTARRPSPAPPGRTARAAGENAVRDGAWSKAGTPGRRPGDHPAVLRVGRPALPRMMRAGGERALMQQSMRRLGPAADAPAPHGTAGWFWARVFAPVYGRIPWGIKRRMVGMTSGVKGWRSGSSNTSAGRPGPHSPVSTTYSRSSRSSRR